MTSTFLQIKKDNLFISQRNYQQVNDLVGQWTEKCVTQTEKQVNERMS